MSHISCGRRSLSFFGLACANGGCLVTARVIHDSMRDRIVFVSIVRTSPRGTGDTAAAFSSANTQQTLEKADQSVHATDRGQARTLRGGCVSGTGNRRSGMRYRVAATRPKFDGQVCQCRANDGGLNRFMFSNNILHWIGTVGPCRGSEAAAVSCARQRVFICGDRTRPMGTTHPVG